MTDYKITLEPVIAIETSCFGGYPDQSRIYEAVDGDNNPVFAGTVASNMVRRIVEVDNVVAVKFDSDQETYDAMNDGDTVRKIIINGLPDLISLHNARRQIRENRSKK